MSNPNDYKTGYMRPPEEHKFKKGISGNSKGRPKKSLNTITLIQKELEEKIQLKEGGLLKTMTKKEALIKRTINKGIEGDMRNAALAFSLIDRVDLKEAENQAIKDSLNETDEEILLEFKEEVRKEIENENK